MFNWFRKPMTVVKVVRLLQGKNGRYRWTARIDGRLMAVCRVQGYVSWDEAEVAARATLGGGWVYQRDAGQYSPDAEVA